MAILAGTVVIRDAPGSAVEFLASLPTCNDTSDFNPNGSFYFIDTANQMPVCGQPEYNITASFPACENVTDSCYPVSCLYEDSSRSNLEALCEAAFLRFVPMFGQNNDGSPVNMPRCPFGILNSFQVCLGGGLGEGGGKGWLV